MYLKATNRTHRYNITKTTPTEYKLRVNKIHSPYIDKSDTKKVALRKQSDYTIIRLSVVLVCSLAAVFRSRNIITCGLTCTSCIVYSILKKLALMTYFYTRRQ